MNYLDLFSGIGGFHLGLRQAGFNFNRVFYSEINKYAISVYRRQFPNAEGLGAVETIRVEELPKLDLVTFGFPCQDLSIAGRRGGLKSSRSGLFFEAMQIVKIKRPHYFIWENVMGLLSSQEGHDIIAVETEMMESGYLFDYSEQNTKWYLPQNRQRIYCVGVDLLWISKEIIKDGQLKKMSLYKSIIQGYLLSKLQQNLGDRTRPQELDSIGLALDWLITQKLMLNGHKKKLQYLKILSEWVLDDYPNLYHDIHHWLSELKNTNLDWFLNIARDSRTVGILLNTPMEKLPESIAKLWENISEENLLVLNKCIISIIAKSITKSKTFISAEVENITWLCIDRLKVLSPDLWNLALSNLIQEQENMKYAENRRDKDSNTEKNDNLMLPFSNAEREQNKSKRHIRERPRPKIFPIGEGDFVPHQTGNRERGSGKRISSTIDSRYGALRNAGETYLMQIFAPKKSSMGTRIYDSKGIACSISSEGDGLGAKTGLYKVYQKPRGFNKGGIKDELGTLTDHNFYQNNYLFSNSKIRRLTPLECERLQGFLDNWTKYGNDGKQISDTQRYKMLGNAVSVPVVEAVGKRIVETLL